MDPYSDLIGDSPSLLEAALAYAAQGVPVFPCEPETKRPRLARDRDANGKPIPGTGGHKKASLDPIKIKQWWAKWPDSWIGYPTGPDSKIDLLDLDRKNEKNGFVAVPDWLDLSPVIIRTHNGGAHACFASTGRIKCTNDKIALGVDTRGLDGYGILPPSGRYEFIRGGAELLGNGLPAWPEKYRPPQVNGTDGTPHSPGTRIEAPIELVRAALAVIPNGDAVAWDDWSDVGMCVWRATGGSEDGFDAFCEWSAKNDKFDLEKTRERWDHWSTSSQPTRYTAGSLVLWADKAHGGPEWRPKSDAAEEFDEIGEPATKPKLVLLDAGIDIGDPAKLSPRPFLLATVFCKRNLSMLGGAGAAGKTSLRITQYLSLATGRSLTKEHVFKRSRVLLLSFEDDVEELKRRISAAKKHHQVFDEDVRGWFYFVALSRKDGKLTLVKDGKIVPGELEKNLRTAIADYRLDLIGFDPLVKIHDGSDENSNVAMDDVMSVLTELAITENIAVDCVAHLNKMMADPGDASRIRGAGAQKDAARLVYTLTAMSVEEARVFGVNEVDRKSYVRFDRGKVNYGRPEAAKWFRLVGTKLGNDALDPDYPHGDEVQVAEPWDPPQALGGLSDEAINAILDALAKGTDDGNRYSAHPRAQSRKAWSVIRQFAPEKSEAACRAVIKAWLDAGVMVEEDYEDILQRKTRKGLKVVDEKRPLAAVREFGEC